MSDGYGGEEEFRISRVKPGAKRSQSRKVPGYESDLTHQDGETAGPSVSRPVTDDDLLGEIAARGYGLPVKDGGFQESSDSELSPELQAMLEAAGGRLVDLGVAFIERRIVPRVRQWLADRKQRREAEHYDKIERLSRVLSPVASQQELKSEDREADGPDATSDVVARTESQSTRPTVSMDYSEYLLRTQRLECALLRVQEEWELLSSVGNLTDVEGQIDVQAVAGGEGLTRRGIESSESALLLEAAADPLVNALQSDWILKPRKIEEGKSWLEKDAGDRPTPSV